MRNQTIHENVQIKQWRMLFVYHLFRLVTIVVLLSIFLLDDYKHIVPFLYYIALLGYLLFGVLAFYIWSAQRIEFEQQVLGSGIVDLIVIVLFVHFMGYLQSGLEVLLFVYIALLSILLSGHLAIFFAAVAACMLLSVSAFEYLYGIQDDVKSIFVSGIYGAGFFATALTAWYLAKFVQSSEDLAHDRARELAEIHRLNEYIVERMQYGVLYLDSMGKVKIMNSAACQFFGIAQTENTLLLKDFSEKLFNKYTEFLSKRNNEAQSAQTTIEKPYLFVHFFAASKTEKTPVLILMEDMGLLAQQAQQLKLASLGRFSASIAHELRNPLGVISHAVQLLGEEHPLTQDDQRLKALITKHCHRMNGVIQNVLQLSRRENSNPECIHLFSFLSQFKTEFYLMNACDLSIAFSEKNSPEIMFDKSQLEQILVILCDNSIKHGRNGDESVKITFSILMEGSKTSLMVCDEGRGISQKIQDNIFEPFFSTLRSELGMGLFIAKELCEMNQSQLTYVETQTGCCFAVHFNQDHGIRL